MTSFLESMIARAKADKQTIVLAEGDDPRTLEAAETILAQDVANLIILGDVEGIKASGRNLEGAQLIDPRTSELAAEFADTFYELRKNKGMTPEKGRRNGKGRAVLRRHDGEDRPCRRHGCWRAPRNRRRAAPQACKS